MTVPEGWKLVPVEPTQAMVEAAFDALPNSPLEGRIRTHYRAMLAAAPTPPVQQDEEDSYCPTCGEEDGGTGCGAIRCGLVDGEQDDEALALLRRIVDVWGSPWPPGADPMQDVMRDARALLTKRGAA